MKLSRDQVRHVAELAKLGLTEDEVEQFAGQLSEILDYAEMLNRLDTDAIPPTAHVFDRKDITRPDQIEPSLSPDQVLANAPRRQGDYFLVQRILD
jgi:aspartyl-tRNA(Asn)/glutamyl-tRNA(Gln) amidotransferase subunit C